MGLEQLQRIRAERDLPKPKTIYRIKKVSDKKAARDKQFKENNTDEGMDKFFAYMRKSMTGKCLFCSGDTMKKDDEKYHFSLAHILPKAIFKSVATNPNNIIELCFYGNSCHTNFDHGIITWEFIKDSKEWDIIKEKLFDVLPLIAPDERSNKLYSKLENLIYEK